MGAEDRGRQPPFGTAIDLWVAVPGGIHPDGTTVGKPPELAHAELTLSLCRQFGCLPSQLANEPSTFLRLLAIEARGRPREEVNP